MNKLPHICTRPYQVFACKILISVLPHSTCLHTKHPYLHYFTPCVANKALISALFHIHSVKLRSLSSAPYGLFRGTSCCETSLDRPLGYRPLRFLLPQSPTNCTYLSTGLYKESQLFLQRSSTGSTKKLDYFYVEAQLFLRRCSTNCLKDLYKSSVIFWFRAI